MPNIQLNYLYRCGGNYKNFGEVIFANPDGLSLQQVEEAIKATLIDHHWFYAHHWHLPSLHFPKWDPELDHLWHEYEGVEYTGLPATDARSISQFMAAIKL